MTVTLSDVLRYSTSSSLTLMHRTLTKRVVSIQKMRTLLPEPPANAECPPDEFVLRERITHEVRKLTEIVGEVERELKQRGRVIPAHDPAELYGEFFADILTYNTGATRERV